MDDSHNFDGEHNDFDVAPDAVAVIDVAEECEQAALRVVTDPEEDTAEPEENAPKFKIKATDLHKPAALISKVISASHSKPILQCVCIDVLPEGKLLLRGSDGDRYAMAEVDCDVEEGGAFLVQSTRFLAVLKHLTGRVEFRMEGDQLFMLDEANAKVMLQSTPIEGYPQAAGQPDGEVIRFGIETELFTRAVSAALKSCAVDLGRYALNNVAFRFGPEGRLTIVGTDGRRLWRSLFNLDVEFAEEVIGHSFLLPRPATETLLAYIKDRKPKGLEVAISRNVMGVNLDGLQLYSQGNNGEYPDFDSVIPKENEYRLRFDRQEMSKVIDLALCTTSIESAQACFSIESDSVLIKTRASGVGATEAPCDAGVKSGEDVKLGFDPGYVREGMSFFPEDKPKVVMDFQDVNTGALFHQGKPEEMLYLVMPMDPS